MARTAAITTVFQSVRTQQSAALPPSFRGVARGVGRFPPTDHDVDLPIQPLRADRGVSPERPAL